MKIYELTHEFENALEGYDEITYISVYSTYKKAENALERLKNNPKFCDHPEGFIISPIEVDQTFWQDGFTSWDEN